MQIKNSNFKEHKQQALKKLEFAMKDNKVDTSLISLLQTINSFEDYFTTSSCAGRIVLLQLPKIGDKKNAVFLGRWHREVNKDEVISSLDFFDKGQLWLITQPPIFHIGCRTLSAANYLMKQGVSAGFKHSGIRSISGQIITELKSTERMDMPLGSKGKRVIPDELIPFLVESANISIRRSKKKLSRLKEEIEKM